MIRRIPVLLSSLLDFLLLRPDLLSHLLFPHVHAQEKEQDPYGDNDVSRGPEFILKCRNRSNSQHIQEYGNEYVSLVILYPFHLLYID